MDWTAELETMVDKQSLASVLEALWNLCHDKAEHVRTNWQDEGLARTWEKAANDLGKIHVAGI